MGAWGEGSEGGAGQEGWRLCVFVCVRAPICAYLARYKHITRRR